LGALLGSCLAESRGLHSGTCDAKLDGRELQVHRLGRSLVAGRRTELALAQEPESINRTAIGSRWLLWFERDDRVIRSPVQTDRWRLNLSA
jgi:hypothetical protein